MYITSTNTPFLNEKEEKNGIFKGSTIYEYDILGGTPSIYLVFRLYVKQFTGITEVTTAISE